MNDIAADSAMQVDDDANNEFQIARIMVLFDKACNVIRNKDPEDIAILYNIVSERLFEIEINSALMRHYDRIIEYAETMPDTSLYERFFCISLVYHVEPFMELLDDDGSINVLPEDNGLLACVIANMALSILRFNKRTLECMAAMPTSDVIHEYIVSDNGNKRRVVNVDRLTNCISIRTRDFYALLDAAYSKVTSCFDQYDEVPMMLAEILRREGYDEIVLKYAHRTQSASAA